MSVPVVYDTMLFLQPAVQPVRIHRSIKAIQEGLVTSCLSVELLAEVRDVLRRPKVRLKFPALTAEAVFVTEIASMATMFDPVPSQFTWHTDPGDDHIFNLAIRPSRIPRDMGDTYSPSSFGNIEKRKHAAPAGTPTTYC